jgi:LysM repeat protein
VKYVLKNKAFIKKLCFILIPVFMMLYSPIHANAGILSFVSGMFEQKHEIKDAKDLNSQNMALLHAALNIDPNPAKGGGDITIVEGTSLLPDSGPSGTIADVKENTNSSDSISLYVVRDGDSISQIAKMFGVSSNTIVWANDVKRGSVIHKGQTLVILPVSGVRHTVKKGETLKSIAKKYKGNFNEILDFNGFSKNSIISVGDIVIIPDGEISAPRYRSSSRKVVRGTNVPSYKGYYIRPINGGRKSQGLHGYNAVDLAAPYGTPIFASASGRVIISKSGGWNGGYGNYIVIRHPNGTQTLYSHSSRNIVSVGQNVVQGQVIAYIGSTGKSTGNHVHFEIRGARNPF